MRLKRTFPILSLLGLIGCTPPVGFPLAAPEPATERIPFGQIKITASGQCVAQTAPQTQTQIIKEQIAVTPAVLAPDGRVLTPPVFRDQSRPASTAISAGIQFETLCPAELTPERIATLQRALEVRGVYNGVITSVLDQGTVAAIRAFQAPLGFDSTILARSIAENLGIVPVTNLRATLSET